MKKKIYIIVIILIVFNIFLFLGPTNSYINQIYKNTETFFIQLTNKVDSVKNTLRENWQLQEENKRLLEENEKIKIEKNELRAENEILKQDNLDMQNTLKIQENSDQEILMADVLYKKMNTPFNIFVIDKGADDKVLENQLVTYDGQVVGYISKVDKKQSEVTLLKNENITFNIPIKIKAQDKEMDGIISSYSSLENKLIVTTILDQNIAEVGDKVYTNGYGQNQAEEIYVGEISQINEEDNLQKQYYVPIKDESFEYFEVNLDEN